MTPFLPQADPRFSSDDEKENNAISIEDLRVVAAQANYRQIDQDKSRSVVSYLRTHRSYSMKISVYYATGVVGACLHRSKQGRSHAVLEHMTLREAKVLFENPIAYLKSEGYAEMLGCNQWKSLSRLDSKKTEHDAICRWRYCSTVTRMCQSEQQLSQLLHVIALYDDLSFVPGSTRSNFCKETRVHCGSKCCLETLLQEIARDFHGAVGFYWGCKGEWQCPLVLNMDACPHAKEFWEEYWGQVQELKHHLISLPPHLRHDVLIWLFSRGHCGSTFFDVDLNLLDYYCPGLDEAHRDYGRLVEAGRNKKRTSVCWSHGIKMGKMPK